MEAIEYIRDRDKNVGSAWTANMKMLAEGLDEFAQMKIEEYKEKTKCPSCGALITTSSQDNKCNKCRFDY